MEVRILRDGQVVFLAPDERLVEVAEILAPDHPDLRLRRKGHGDGRHNRDRRGGQSGT